MSEEKQAQLNSTLKRKEETKPKKQQIIRVKALPVRKFKMFEGETDFCNVRIEPRRSKIDLIKCVKSARLGDMIDDLDDQIEMKSREKDDEISEEPFSPVSFTRSFSAFPFMDSFNEEEEFDECDLAIDDHLHLM